MRYLWSMELSREESGRDFELQHACVACGGSLMVRVTPGVARAVCSKCRTFSTMRVVPGADGVAVISRPAGAA